MTSMIHTENDVITMFHTDRYQLSIHKNKTNKKEWFQKHQLSWYQILKSNYQH